MVLRPTPTGSYYCPEHMPPSPNCPAPKPITKGFQTTEGIAELDRLAQAPRTAPQTPQERTEATKRHDHHPDPKLPDTESKRDQAPALGAAVQGKAAGMERARVRFVGYRVRPLDPDNFAGSVKDLLDGLRHFSLIEGDEPWRIILETEQVKVGSFKEEKTVIEITT